MVSSQALRLGIAVVYLVTPGNERLLDLHLDFIARHTTVPYTIYGVAVRLPAELTARLGAAPHLRLADLPSTERRGPEEHAHYLEHLVAAALADGASHVATFHVDSFPLRSGWAEELAAQLSERRPLAAALRDDELDQKPCTAFILARRDFIERQRPTFLLPPDTLRSAAFRAYRRRFRVHADSGVGYGFAAWRAGLEWLPLERSNRGEDHGHFGSVHGDLVFHLGAAAWQKKDYPGSHRLRMGWRLQNAVSGTLDGLLPGSLRGRLKRTILAWAPRLGSEPRYAANEQAFRQVRSRLLDDPGGYLSFLRFGPR